MGKKKSKAQRSSRSSAVNTTTNQLPWAADAAVPPLSPPSNVVASGGEADTASTATTLVGDFQHSTAAPPALLTPLADEEAPPIIIPEEPSSAAAVANVRILDDPTSGEVSTYVAGGDHQEKDVGPKINELSEEACQQQQLDGRYLNAAEEDDKRAMTDGEDETPFIGDLETASAHNGNVVTQNELVEANEGTGNKAPIVVCDQDSVSSRSTHVGGGDFLLEMEVDEEGQLYDVELNKVSAADTSSSSSEEPQPVEGAAATVAADDKRSRSDATSRRPLSYRWTVICLVLTLAAIVLSIALPLGLIQLKNPWGDAENTKPNDDPQEGPPSPQEGPPSTAASSSGPATITSVAGSQLQEALQLVLPTDLYQRMTNDITSSEYAAYQFLLQDDPEITPPTLQRFVVAHWNKAVAGEALTASLSECVWDGVECDDDHVVRAIRWNNRTLSGRLPDSMLPSLTTIDLGENALRGGIPASWYRNASALEYLYLHSNALTGQISTHVAQWTSLRRLYLGGNQLTGSLPKELGSARSDGSNVRSLEVLLLPDNKLTGTLPLNWNLRNLFSLDLGNNQLSGQIPTDWVRGMASLRLLYLDRNQFTGTVPSRMGEIGKGRLSAFSIYDNEFTGIMPTFYNYTKLLNFMEIQNNDFTGMSSDMCKHSVYDEGEMVRLRADCSVCPCKNLCDDCLDDNGNDDTEIDNKNDKNDKEIDKEIDNKNVKNDKNDIKRRF